MAWHRHTSPTNFTTQQSRSFRRRLRSASSHELSISRTRLSELFQSPLYGSGTVFPSISYLFRHFLSSAVAWGHFFKLSYPWLLLSYQRNDNRILNFLEWILLGNFHWKNVLNFHGLKWRTLRKTGCYWAEEYTTSQLTISLFTRGS